MPDRDPYAALAGLERFAGRSFVEEAGGAICDLAALRARRDEILALAARFGISSVVVFGSVARGTPRPDSDVDVAVTLAPDADFLALCGFDEELRRILGGRDVDVVEVRPGLKAELRESIARDGVPL